MESFVIVKDPNAGNGPNTYYKGACPRPFCVRFGNAYLRDSAGRVRRFASREAAHKAASKQR
jgi:hypothetical protein